MGMVRVWRCTFGLLLLAAIAMLLLTCGPTHLSKASGADAPCDATTGPGYRAYPTVVVGPRVLEFFYPNSNRDGYQDAMRTNATYTYVAFADLDRDGILDEILADRNRDSRILWGADYDSWPEDGSTVLLTTYACGCAAGDFNGDGALDLAFESTEADLQVFLNRGDGTFSQYPDINLTGNQAWDLRAGDLNDDGFDDFVTTIGALFFGGPDGPDNFVDRCYPVPEAQEVDIVDANMDGYLDLIFTVMTTSKMMLFLGGSSGIDTTVDLTFTVGDIHSTDVGDINGDGLLDLVMTGWTPPRLIIIRGEASGWNFQHRCEIPLAVGLVPMTVCDIDLDGFDDILVGNNSTFDVYLGGDEWPPVRDISKPYTDERWEIWAAVPRCRPPEVTLPSAPLDVCATRGDRLIHLSWEAPLDTGGVQLLGFDVLRGTSAGELSVISRVNRKERSLTDVSLEVGRTYFYAVRAVNVGGEGPQSSIVEMECLGTPLAPLMLEAMAGRGNVSLTWHHPSDTGGLPLLGYRLFRGRSPLEMDHCADLGVVDGYVDVDVMVARSYSYAILAYNAMGNGSLSWNVTAVPFDVPGVPSSLLVSGGDSLVTLRWGPPSTGSGVPLLGYHILRGPSSDSLRPFATVDASVMGFNDTSVVNGVTFYYTVEAFNKAGDGPPFVVLSATPLGPPGIVRNLVGQAGDSMVTISWDPPETDGGLPIDGYRVLRGSRPADLRLVKELEATSFSEGGLPNGVGIYYQVIAFNGVGLGPPSDVVLIIPADPPGPPLDIFVEASVGLVNISWLPPTFDGGSGIIHYRVYRGLHSEGLELLATVAEVPLWFVDGGLDAGTTYNYAVTAVTAAGEGPLSRLISATPFGLASAPLDLKAVAGSGRVVLTWRRPVSDGGEPISGYVVLRGNSSDALSELERSLGDLTYTDRSVVDGVTYFYAIAAVNAVGSGAMSETAQATPQQIRSAPGKIGALAVEIEGVEVNLEWTPPEEDGGSPVTGYVVLRGVSGDSLEIVANLGPVTTWTDTAVERGKTYFYTVAATNGVGQGEALTASEVNVPKETVRSPGFEAISTGAALAAAILVMASRRKLRLDR
jgi:fibronectin type 3 domain-containing protein